MEEKEKQIHYLNTEIDELQNEITKAKEYIQKLENVKNQMVVELDHCVVQIKETDNEHKMNTLRQKQIINNLELKSESLLLSNDCVLCVLHLMSNENCMMLNQESNDLAEYYVEKDMEIKTCLDMTEKHDEMKREGEIRSSRKRENEKNQIINTSKKCNDFDNENEALQIKKNLKPNLESGEIMCHVNKVDDTKRKRSIHVFDSHNYSEKLCLENADKEGEMKNLKKMKKF